MKITKSELKKLLIEEIESNPEMLKAINSLTNSIEDLDVSIDYLTSAVTGDDPFTTNLLQKGFGRLVGPSGKNKDITEGDHGEGSMAVRQLNNLSQMVQELQGMVDESDNHEEWIESKITKAHDYLNTVLNYLSGADAKFNPMSERELTDSEEDEKEDIVKGMKKNKKDFKKRYGKDAESVMHGAATNIAKKNRGKK
tara:strand:+ start:2085 stop:2675 length:591 start_codon:yes stop_codon:yes gene_type:complete